MFIYTNQSINTLLENENKVELIEDEFYTEASDNEDTFILLDNIYPKVESVLKTNEGKRSFADLVARFINRHSEELSTIGPCHLIPFNYQDKAGFYTLFNIKEEEIKPLVKEVIKTLRGNKDIQLLNNNPIFILFYFCIRYFTVNKDSQNLNNALMITSLAMYPSIFHKYYKFNPNPSIMQYTIDTLSQRFMIKKSGHIFGTLATSIQNSWKYHEKDFYVASDKEVVRFIQRIRNDQNSLMKKIANEYFINHKKGLGIQVTKDEYDGNIVVDNETDSNKVENLTNKIVTQLVVDGVDLKICDFASNAANVSKLDLRNYITMIVTEKRSEEMKKFIESILFIYLYDEKHTFEEINSKMFIGYALSLFKKTNSKDKNIQNIKATLDKWGEDTKIYSKFTRVATRVDYTKAIFLYFILSIQKYT